MFNKKLAQSLKEPENSYLNNALSAMSRLQGLVHSKIFGTGKSCYSFVDEVVVIHMTLITERLYMID